MHAYICFPKGLKIWEGVIRTTLWAWGRVPHHSVALHSRQLEGGEALVVGHEVQGLQAASAPVVGQQQVVHLAGGGLVGLEDEDVQHCVSWGRTRVSRGHWTHCASPSAPSPRFLLPVLTQGILGPDVGSMFDEQTHDLLAAHAGSEGQRVLPWGHRGLWA